MRPMDRPCSSADCEVAAECAGLMCEAHWSRLPPRLQEIVLDSWLAFKRGGAGNGRWVAYNSLCRHATAALLTVECLPEAYRAKAIPVGRVRTEADPP